MFNKGADIGFRGSPWLLSFVNYLLLALKFGDRVVDSFHRWINNALRSGFDKTQLHGLHKFLCGQAAQSGLNSGHDQD